MFYEVFQAKLHGFNPFAKELKDGGMDEGCKITLVYEFTEKFAQGLGIEVEKDLKGFIKMLHTAMSRNRITACRIPVPAEDVTATFSDQESDDKDAKLDIRDIKMCSVQARRPNAEDPSPVVAVTLEIPTTDERMLWFGNRLMNTINVCLDKLQGKLPGVE